MNIIQIQEDLKDASDNQLMETMQTGSAPQYLVISEMQRRKDMRNRHQKQQGGGQQGSVAEDLISGIAGLPSQMQVPEDGIASFARGGKVAEMGGKEKARAVERGFEDATYKDQYTGEDIEPRKKPDLRKAKNFATGGAVDLVKAELPRREGPRGDTTGAAETGKKGLTANQYARIRETYGDVSEEEAIDIYMNELNSEISSLPGYEAASPNLQAALLDSAYNTGGLSDFPRLRAALAELPETGDEESVARELLDSASIDGGTSKGIAKRRAENYNSILSDPSRAITEVEQTDDGELIYWAGDNEVFRYGQDMGRHASSEPGIIGVTTPNIQMAEADTSSWKDMTPQERRQRDLEKYEAQDMPMPVGGVEMPGGRGRAVPEPAPEKAEGLEALAQANNRGLPGAQSGVAPQRSAFTGEDTQVAQYEKGGEVRSGEFMLPNGNGVSTKVYRRDGGGQSRGEKDDGRRFFLTDPDFYRSVGERSSEVLDQLTDTSKYGSSQIPMNVLSTTGEGLTELTKTVGGQGLESLRAYNDAAEKPMRAVTDMAYGEGTVDRVANRVRDMVPERVEADKDPAKVVVGESDKQPDMYDIVSQQAEDPLQAKANAAEQQLLQQRDPQAEVDPQVDPYLEELRKRRADTSVSGRERLSEFLMATGIGMMASDDPDTLRNLGVGGMQGLEALQNLKKDERIRMQGLDQQEGAYTRQVAANEAAMRKAQAKNVDPRGAIKDAQDAANELAKVVTDRRAQLQEDVRLDPTEIDAIIQRELQDPQNPMNRLLQMADLSEDQLKRYGIQMPERSNVALPQGWGIRPKSE